jgi:hypothetical protein
MSTILPNVDAQAARLDTTRTAHAPTAVLDMESPALAQIAVSNLTEPPVFAVAACLSHIPLAVPVGAALPPTDLRADAHAVCKQTETFPHFSSFDNKRLKS